MTYLSTRRDGPKLVADNPAMVYSKPAVFEVFHIDLFSQSYASGILTIGVAFASAVALWSL